MPTATVLGAFYENGYACLAIRVIEQGENFEYVGRVPLDETWAGQTAAQRKAALIAAVKAVRQDALEVGPQPFDIGAGTVTV